MFRRLSQIKNGFDFEVSVDETRSPTTPLEHFFIASELTRLGVLFTSLAPRFPGRFEKGVDYIGNLQALEAELGTRPEAREELVQLLRVMRTDIGHVRNGLERFVRLIGANPDNLEEADRWLDRIDERLEVLEK